jgi:hypothetical protein
MSTPLVETRIVDAHLHYYQDNPLYNPDTLFEHGVINTAWILSTNGLVRGSATDQEILDLSRRYSGRIVPFAFLDDTGTALFVAAALTRIGIVIVGAAKTTMTKTHPLTASFENLSIGIAGGVLSYLVGMGLDSLMSRDHPATHRSTRYPLVSAHRRVVVGPEMRAVL